MMSLNQIGVIGMAVMGKNIALNLKNNGYKVSVYNRTYSVTQNVIQEHPDLCGYQELKDFVNSLETPRKILIMVQAGKAVDAVLEQLFELLEPNDIIMDGGNSYFKDTIRRENVAKEKGFYYLGVGVSGGEEGALKGPAIMPGGSKEAYDKVEEMLVSISAKAFNEPCVTYIGENGAGHYVKMVHNGIEYGDMQLIAESFDVLKQLGGFDYDQLADIFKQYNKGKLDSYLIEITSKVVNAKDDLTDNYLLDVILDKAGNKGTGKWTVENSLELGQNASVMVAALYNRFLSFEKQNREVAHTNFIKPEVTQVKDKQELIELVEASLYFSKIMSYAQGFNLMKEAAANYGWSLNFTNISKIFRGGCIIRAKFLNDIAKAYEKKPDLINLMLDDFFRNEIQQSHQAIRKLVTLAINNGISVAGFSSALAYFDGFTNRQNPANLIQAQRDYFGAHTYERTDREGSFHYDWFTE